MLLVPNGVEMLSPLKSPHLGVGLYSVAEVARLLRVPQSNIRRWTSAKDGLVPRVLEAEEKTLTFIELIELSFIAMLRNADVSMQTVRKLSQAASERFDSDYPFSMRRFGTEGKAVFAKLIAKEMDADIAKDLRHGQDVFNEVVRPFYRKLEYDNSPEVARYWPMQKRGRIVLDPKRKFGKPIDAKSGIPTQIIHEAINADGGQPPDVVAEWLGISLAAVEAAIAFEQAIAP